MRVRTGVILLTCLAVLAGGGLGTANGMVVCVDRHGHVAVEAPHAGGDAHHHDGCGDSGAAVPTLAPGHDDDRGCSDSAVILVMSQKSDRASAAVVACAHGACLPQFLASACDWVSRSMTAPGDEGAERVVTLASLRSVVLLV